MGVGNFMIILISIILIVAYVVIKFRSNSTKSKATTHFLIAIVLAATMIGIMINNNNTPHINPAIKHTVLGLSIIPFIENIRVGVRILRKPGSIQ